jgi:N-methylhydantoinase A
MPAHFSALGMLLADLKHDYVQTLVRELAEISGPDLADSFSALEKSAMQILIEEGAEPDRVLSRRFLDMRYRGQEYTLPVPVTEDLRTVTNFDGLRSRFDQLHQEHYGHSAPGEPVMIVNLRLSALGRFDNPISLASDFHDGDRGQRGTRAVMFDDPHKPVTCPIFLRAGLSPGERLEGPAAIEEIGATILVYPGDSLTVNEFGHLVIDVKP